MGYSDDDWDDGFDDDDDLFYDPYDLNRDGSTRPYFYRVKDISLEAGDKVIVPVGRENEEKQGVVVSVGQYSEYSVPFPPEKTKFILRKYN